MKLNPVSYKLKGTNQKDIGFLAQEVKTILPELVYGEEGEMTLSYGQMISVLAKAIQEQQRKIDSQQLTIDNQQSAIHNLQAESKSWQRAVGRMQTENQNLKTEYGIRLSRIEQLLNAETKK